MNKQNLLTLIALLVIVVALPYYAEREPARMAQAQQRWQQTMIDNAIPMYLDNCALCHGTGGEGIAAMPPLTRLTESGAGAGPLYDKIAHAAHGTPMATWHPEDGSALNEYEIRELVTLIQYADWGTVQAIAESGGVTLPDPPVMPADDSYLLYVKETDPHRCISCHEEPAVHAGQFGLECGRCHGTAAWRPALLTRHTFALDHGEMGVVDCKRCHSEVYTAHSCTDCHDHPEAEMETIHVAEGYAEYQDCVRCHPTGAAGEAERLRQMGMLESGGVRIPLNPETAEQWGSTPDTGRSATTTGEGH